ncbi:MAG: Gfo/Idh/MocA family oxidoreductase [Candidatus Marsarchaeota archaeon]
MADKLKVVYVGCGGIAEAHARGVATFPDVQFAGFYDVVPEAARSFAQKYGGEAYPSVGEMLDKVKPDACYYFLPPFAHGSEVEAAKRGIPFFVEKPVVLDLDLGKKILSTVKEKGVITAAGYMNRYRKSVNYAREAFSQDPPILMIGGWIGGTPARDWWWIHRDKSGTQLHEQVTHTVDQARYFAGDVTQVQAFAANGFNKGVPAGYDIDDAAVMNLKFSSGAVANIYSSTSSNSLGGVFLNVYAYDTAAVFEKWEQNLRLYRDHGAVQITINGEPDIFKIEDRAFLDAVKSGDRTLVRSDYEDALKTAAVTLSALESLRRGSPISLGAGGGIYGR